MGNAITRIDRAASMRIVIATGPPGLTMAMNFLAVDFGRVRLRGASERSNTNRPARCCQQRRLST
jgi:hypothetical protein